MASVDYYELLGLPDSHVSESDIKLAFRKKALQLHPDKNRDIDPAKATEIFQGVQHAYEVLSDPNERAWYDAHKDEILRGVDPDGAGAKPSARASSVDIFGLFSTGAYSGYGPDKKGFFTVYGDAFFKLAEEEHTAGSGVDFPEFGYSKSSWTTTRAFYNEWDSFVTARPFVFADKWNLAEAPDRNVRRLMERDNKKERAAARKEFISLVRNLVAFVKKRDPRVVARKKEEAEETARSQELRQAKAEQEKIERQVEREGLQSGRQKYMEAEMGHVDELIEQMGLKDQSDAEEATDFYCAACRRKFRSQAQWDNHEKSKKHIERVTSLRQTMGVEDTLEFRVGTSEALDQSSGSNDVHTYPSRSPTVEPPLARNDEQNIHIDMEHNSSLEQPAPLENQEVEEYVSRSKKKQLKKLKKQAIRNQPSASTASGHRKEGIEPLAVADPGGEDLNRQSPETIAKNQGSKTRRRKKNSEARTRADISSLACTVCGKDFKTRNKLFTHIKEEGHAILK